MNTLGDLATDIAHEHREDRDDALRTLHVLLEQVEGADGITYDADDLPLAVAACLVEAYRIGAEFQAVFDEVTA